MIARVYSRFSRGIWLITAIGFLNSAGFSLSLPFISLYLYLRRGLSMTEVGMVILVTGLVSAMMQLVAGILTDRFGRKPMLVGSVGAGIILQFGLAAFVAINAPVPVIIFAYASVRAGLVMGRPAFSAMIADLAPAEKLSESYGLLRVGQNAGWAAGPAIGGYLAGVLSYAWLFAFAGVIGIFTLVFSLRLLKETAQEGTRTNARAGNLIAGGIGKEFIFFLLINSLIFIVVGQMTTTLSVFSVNMAGFSTVQFGLLLTLNGLVVVCLQYPMTRWLSFLSNARALALGSIFYAIGYAAIGFSVGAFPVAVGAMLVVTLGEIVIAPTAFAVVGELAPPNWRGRYMGIFGLFDTLGTAVGPLVGGVFLDRFAGHPMLIWGNIGGLAVVASIGFLIWNGGRRKLDKSN